MKQMDSPLKFQTRCVSLSPSGSGFAVGSVDSKVGIQYFDPAQARFAKASALFSPCTSKNVAFKAHRSGNDVHSVHGVDWHPKYHETLATVGGDGHYCFWTMSRNQQLKKSVQMPAPITCGQFHSSGLAFAYAVSYDWHRVWALVRTSLMLLGCRRSKPTSP